MPQTPTPTPKTPTTEAPAEPPRRPLQSPARKIAIHRSWSRAAIVAATSQATDKKQLNAILSRAAKLALAAAPIYQPLQTALEASPTSPLEIDCFWVDDAEIQRLNREHRSKDKPTDVLSFPLFEGEVFSFPGEDLALGDLVISIETAARQAKEIGHSLGEEVAFLTVHGVLHLLGYDHQNDRDRRKMFALQDQIFDQWKASQK